MNETIRDIQAILRSRGYSLGTSGPARDGVDGDAGTLTFAAILAELKRSPDRAPVASAPFEKPMAWGARVSSVFRDRVRWICDQLDYPEPGDLMTCIAWETGRAFSASVTNMAGSGATGLIQFMPSTAAAMGTSTAALAAMSAEGQLNYVYRYFLPYKGRLRSLADLYMAILWPRAVGKPDDYILFQGPGTIAYRQNAGLDTNKDGKITKAETVAKLYAMRAEGMRPENMR